MQCKLKSRLENAFLDDVGAELKVNQVLYTLADVDRSVITLHQDSLHARQQDVGQAQLVLGREQKFVDSLKARHAEILQERPTKRSHERQVVKKLAHLALSRQKLLLDKLHGLWNRVHH